jgi:CBS domain containing-hemolysin-like protein
MRNLTLHNTQSTDRLAWPEEHFSVSKHTPALSILTDFTKSLPIVISTNARAIDVEAGMKQAHVKMKLVLDINDRFVGIITLNDLSERNLLRKVNKNTRRDELLVSDFMHPRESLKCFDYNELINATVSDVLETQKNNHQQHCLVIDREKHQIRGVISARDAARVVQRSVDIEKHVSFQDLFNELGI